MPDLFAASVVEEAEPAGGRVPEPAGRGGQPDDRHAGHLTLLKPFFMMEEKKPLPASEYVDYSSFCLPIVPVVGGGGGFSLHCPSPSLSLINT